MKKKVTKLMDDEKQTYRTWVNDVLFWLFSDDQYAYYLRFLLLLVVFGASFLVLYFIDVRYWWLIPLAYIVSYISAARFLNDLYELNDLGKALNYLLACSFMANARPAIKVEKGKLKIKGGEINLIERIGGPGALHIAPGNVVLLEKLTGLSRVIGKGKHNIHRYEFIKQVVNLDEQHHPIENIIAVSVDGIPVALMMVHVRFRLRLRESDWVKTYGDSLDGDAYRGAVKNLAYNRLVSESGFMTMNEMVSAIIEDAVKKYINRHTVDQIITPNDRTMDSRRALKKELEGPEVRAQLMNIGVRLVGLELGAFSFPDTPIDKFRLGKWKETKRGEIKVLEAEGQAYEYSRQDAVRSRTQAEMINGIITALEDLEIDDVQDLDTLIKIRTAQILDTWSGLYESRNREDFNLNRYFPEDGEREDEE